MDRKTKTLVIVLLAIIAILCYFIAGTYAKYTKELGGTGTATAAKFDVSAGDLNKEKTATIALFDTIKEADTTSEETHVAANKIAPGTGGSFTISLTNNSEVDVDAVLTFSETENGSSIPIEYSTDGSTWSTASETTKTVNLVYNGKSSGKSSDDVTVYWRWVYQVQDEGSSPATYADRDEDDTGIGETTTAPQVKTQVSVTFTQVD